MTEEGEKVAAAMEEAMAEAAGRRRGAGREVVERGAAERGRRRRWRRWGRG